MGRDVVIVLINNVHLWSFSGDNVRMAEIAAISIVAISYNIKRSPKASQPFSTLLSLEST